MKRTFAVLLIAAVLALGIGIGTTIGGPDMAQADSVSCTATIKAVTTAPNGTMYVLFSSGVQYEFPNGVSDLQDFAMGIQTQDNAERLAVAWWIARDDDANNPSVIIGKTLTLDVSSPSPVKVQ